MLSADTLPRCSNAMCFYNGQAEASSAGFPAPRLFNTVKSLDNVRQIRRRNADARIADAQNHFSIHDVSSQGDPAAGPGELHGILQQIAEYLFKTISVGMSSSNAFKRSECRFITARIAVISSRQLRFIDQVFEVALEMDSGVRSS